MTLADRMTADLAGMQLPSEGNSAKIDSDLPDPLPRWFHKYLMKRRQTIIMELGEIEDLLGLERSIVPRRKR